MIKTFLASTAVVTTLGFAALAQEAGDPLVKRAGQRDAQAPAEHRAERAGARDRGRAERRADEPARRSAPRPRRSPPRIPPARCHGARLPASEQVLTPVVAADISATS